MRRFLAAISRLLPEPRVIFDREGGSIYLSRWYLIGRMRGVDPELRGQLEDEESSRTAPFNLFLHRFHRSDDDEALHNHPWDWAVSLVLAGGYDEERRVDDVHGPRIVRRRVRPFSLNVIRSSDFHRVDLVERDAWSLFLVGKKIDTWYFWDRHRLARTEWRDFIREKRGQGFAKWTADPPLRAGADVEGALM